MSRFGFNKKISNPSGSWTFEQLIDAKVRVKSSSVGNFMSCFGFDSSKLVTIGNIYFRISMDGKAFTVIEIKELPDKVFLWKDIEVVELSNKPRFDALCGTFNCGLSIVGYNVDKNPTYGEDDINGGLSLIDDNGTIISNRFIRIVGADVEDPNTDTNNITDINVNLDGDILD